MMNNGVDTILFLIQVFFLVFAVLINKKFADAMEDKLIATDKSDWWIILFIGFSLNGIFIISLIIISYLIELFMGQ